MVLDSTTTVLIAEYGRAQFAYMLLVWVVVIAPSAFVDENNQRQRPGTDSPVW